MSNIVATSVIVQMHKITKTRAIISMRTINKFSVTAQVAMTRDIVKIKIKDKIRVIISMRKITKFRVTEQIDNTHVIFPMHIIIPM